MVLERVCPCLLGLIVSESTGVMCEVSEEGPGTLVAGLLLEQGMSGEVVGPQS